MVRVVSVTQEFWVRILADPEYFPLGITSLVAAVIRDRLSRPRGAVAGSPRLWLMPGSQEIKGGRV